jgi:hypothetical protein
VARTDSTYTTDYGGTGHTVSVTNPDGTFWSSSTPDDPVAAAAYLAQFATGKLGTGGSGIGSSSGGIGSDGSLSSGALTDVLAGLSGPNRDAGAALVNLFNSYGLGTLAPKIVQFIQQGYAPDTVTILLQQTPEYRQRFSANDARLAKGLSALSPAEYLATERSYRQIMSEAGLPIGFYDSPSDFTSWLANDVSPTEVQGRVQAASDLLNQADPQTLDYMRQHYTTGDLVAYALDSKKALPLIQKQIQASQIGGAAARQGLQIGTDKAEQLGMAGVTQDQAQQGFGFVNDNLGASKMLGGIYGTDITQNDLVNEVFLNDTAATQKRRTLASKERASFGGSSGQSKTSLSSGSAGAI